MPTTEAGKSLISQQTKVQEMRNRAADTAYQGSQIEGQAFTLGDDVMNAVRADRQARGVSRIAQDVGNTMGQLVSDPEAIRARTSATGLVAPNVVNALTSNARALNVQTLGEQATQQSLNQGSLDQIIQAGANQLKARAAALLAQAQQESAKADSLMESLKFQQSEQERLWQQELEKLKLSSSGSGGIPIDFGAGEDDGFIEDPSVAEGPMYSPTAGEETVSPDRKWIYKDGTWQPYQEPSFLQSFINVLFKPKVGDNKVSSGSSLRARSMQKLSGYKKKGGTW